MKINIFIFLFFPFFVAFPQGNVNKVYISSAKAAYLIFPADITDYQIGTREIQIHTKKMGNNVLSMQYTDISNSYIETNLFVILSNGKTYYYDIQLDEKRENYTSFAKEHIAVDLPVNKEKQIDNINDNQIDTLLQKNPVKNKFEKEYLKIMQLSDMFMGAEQKEQKINLKLNAVVYADNHMYIKFTLANRSDIDYVVEYIKFLRTTRTKGKKQSFQEIELPVKAKNQDIIKLLRDEQNTVIYVFDKLTLTKDEDLIIEIKENQGTRDFNFVIPYHFVNNARPVN